MLAAPCKCRHDSMGETWLCKHHTPIVAPAVKICRESFGRPRVEADSTVLAEAMGKIIVPHGET